MNLFIVDAATGVDVVQLVDGQISVAELVGKNIRADAIPPHTRSVRFWLDGRLVRTEGGAPWAMYGDRNGRYNAATLPTGTHVFSAAAYSGPGGRGTRLAGITATAVLGALPPTPPPPPGPTNPPPPTGIQRPAGNGMLIGGNKNNFLSDAQLANPALAFFVPRMRWGYLEPTRGVPDFGILLREIDRYVKRVKQYMVPVMTGPGNVPAWAASAMPWDLAMLDDYLALQIKLEEKTRGELRCAAWVTGPTISSQEMHYTANDGKVVLGKYPGYTPDKMVMAWQYVAAGMHKIYTDCVKVYSLSQQNEARLYVDSVVGHLTVSYPKAHLAFQFNNLQETTSRTYVKPVLDLGAAGFWIGAEKVQPGHDVGFDDFKELKYIVNYSGDERFL